MSRELRISIGQFSDKGRKEINQDFHGALIPREPLLSLKGIAVVIADGISSSSVSQIASESAVKTFLTDYYATPDSWSVKTSAYRVLAATNSWLSAQTRQSRQSHDRDHGYVCTVSAMVIKATTAHLFHAGDSRIYRVAGRSLEQLTEDHRLVTGGESYLSRALGVADQVEIDYRPVAVDDGDVFVLATDGVYDHADPHFIATTIAARGDDLDGAARLIAGKALDNGSADNLTVQIVRIDAAGAAEAGEILERADELPPPPLLEARMEIDGYRIVRELHDSSRSHAYLAVDSATGDTVVLKVPSLDLRGDPAYLRRFMMEEWIARRINNPHVLKPPPQSRRRSYLYVVTEFVDGQTLAQWMTDNPRPDLETVRGIVEQIAQGLGAFHRMEMLHQDLRPQNVMIDKTGTVKIIDFGSVDVAGVAEAEGIDRAELLGTVQYAAPEYFLGEGGSPRADLFSLGVIAYQMLSGRLPYGAQMARARTRAQQRRLKYQSVLDESREIPAWIDKVLAKAVHPDPNKRYGELSEFVFELRHPNPAFFRPEPVPLIERNPLLFWQVLCLLLAAAVAILLVKDLGVAP